MAHDPDATGFINIREASKQPCAACLCDWPRGHQDFPACLKGACTLLNRTPWERTYLHLPALPLLQLHGLLKLLDHPLGYKGGPEEAARAEQEQDTDRLVGELGLQASAAASGVLRQLSALRRQRVWKLRRVGATPLQAAGDALLLCTHLLQAPLLTALTCRACLQVDDDGSIYYHEVLQALTAKAAGISLEALGDKINRELQEEVGGPDHAWV